MKSTAKLRNITKTRKRLNDVILQELNDIRDEDITEILASIQQLAEKIDVLAQNVTAIYQEQKAVRQEQRVLMETMNGYKHKRINGCPPPSFC